MRVGPDDRRGPASARPEFDDSRVSDVLHEAAGLAENWTFRATRHENAPLSSKGWHLFRDVESVPS